VTEFGAGEFATPRRDRRLATPGAH